MLTSLIAIILIAGAFLIIWNVPETTTETTNLTVELSTDKGSYDLGEIIKISITVTNNRDEDVTLEHVDTLSQNFEALNERGEQVYQWALNESCLPFPRKMVIPAGETVEILNTTWEQKDNNGEFLPAGNYSIIGWLVTTPRIYSNTIAVQIQ